MMAAKNPFLHWPPESHLYMKCRLRHGLDNSLKIAFQYRFVVFVLIYAILWLSAAVLNGYVLIRIIRKGLMNKYIFKYLFVLCAVDLLASCFSLPMSLLVQLTYWQYGGFLCVFLPLLQEYLTNLAFLIPLTISIERYRAYVQSRSLALPNPTTIVGVLLAAGCSAFPGTMFVKYYQTEERVHGHLLQVCLVQTTSMEEYARVMFLVMYVAPLLTFAYLAIKIGGELNRQEDVAADMRPSELSFELRAQRYLSMIMSMTAIAWLPLNLTSLMQFGLTEEECGQTNTYDLMYAVLIWIAFTHTLTTPLLALRLVDNDVARPPYFSVQYFRRHLEEWRSSVRRAMTAELVQSAGASASHEDTVKFNGHMEDYCWRDANSIR
uniref:G-protein coupled receptors family 1 profile domain-containing protein n=1 Tax=Plectus sambesii TaxID=2011161 RepID=A0A914W4M1_9BILA